MKMEDPESAPGGAENQAGAGGKGGEDGDEDGELDVSALLQKSQLSTYPDRVEGALEHLLQEEDERDPLDSVDFDPVDYLNDHFPDESAFASNLDGFIAGLNAKIQQSEYQMYQAIRQQAMNSKTAVKNIEESKQAIGQLYEKIQDIRGKAEQSEVMVQEICRDIKRLDFAKRNLTLTITSLKRLHMLVTAVDQLEYMCEKRQYKQVANLLQAIDQLMVHFQDYEAIPKVKQLRVTVARIKDELKTQIFEDFHSISEISADYYGMEQDGDREVEQVSMYYATSTQTPEALAEACYVIDALGADTRRTLIRTLCELWLRPYENIFGPGTSDAALSSTKRRYMWIGRLLKEHDDKYAAIFPDFWLIQYHFVVAFCNSTAKHLKAELGKIDPPENVDVGELMRALRATLDFEKELAERYKPSLESGLDEMAQLPEDATGNSAALHSVDAIKARHERRRSSEHSRPRERSSADLSGDAPLDPNDEEVEAAKLAALKDAQDLEPIVSSISSVFEPYLVSYVKRESEGIQEQLAKVLKEERVDKNGALPVLSSALNLFLTIKSSISRCIKFTTGQAFYDLHREFKSCLQKYSRDLNSKLPQGVLPTQPTTSKRLGGATNTPAFDLEAATTACFVLNSAEYCAETVSQLEEMIQGRIDDAYAEAISLEEEQDLFYTNISNAVHVLVEGIKGELLPDLQKMRAIDWGSFDNVGDQSAYLSSIVAVIKSFFPTLQDLLSDIYFRTFCDKFVFSFLPLYVGTIQAAEKIGEFGAQQLLLDTRALKTSLLEIVASQDEDLMPVDTFNKFVTSELERCEVMLKLVSMSKGTEPSLLLENFQILWKDGTLRDLESVLKLRGMNKAEQGKILKSAEAAGVSKSDGKAQPKVPVMPLNASPGSGKKQSMFGKQNINMGKLNTKFDFFNSMKGFSADMTSSLQTSYKRAVTKNPK